MATESEIAALRRMTALAADDATYTDSLLGLMIDDLGFETSASQIWKEKAAAAADLVDMSESGSSRSLSQLREGYLEMATALGPKDPLTPSAGSYTVAVERI